MDDLHQMGGGRTTLAFCIASDGVFAQSLQQFSGVAAFYSAGYRPNCLR
jgi:hypothetical protein